MDRLTDARTDGRKIRSREGDGEKRSKGRTEVDRDSWRERVIE